MATHDKVLEISFNKAIAILAGAVLTSIVGTAFTVFRILNTDHFVLANTVEDVETLKNTTVNKEVYRAESVALYSKVDTMEKNLTEKIDTISRQLNQHVQDVQKYGR